MQPSLTVGQVFGDEDYCVIYKVYAFLLTETRSLGKKKHGPPY